MKIKTNAGLINSLTDISLFEILVNDNNYVKVKKKIESELDKSLNILHELKDKGKIKSMSLPRNKEIQESLNKLVKFRKTLKNSLDKIKLILDK
jgi:hypothetical protein